MIRRLAYVSRARPDLPAAEIPRIVVTARANNERDGLTGVLVYTGTDFAQLIEGPVDAVTALWQRVAVDPRHREVVTLLDETNHRPWFPDWRMGYMLDPDLARQIANWRVLQRTIHTDDRDELRRVLAAADAM